MCFSESVVFCFTFFNYTAAVFSMLSKTRAIVEALHHRQRCRRYTKIHFIPNMF